MKTWVQIPRANYRRAVPLFPTLPPPLLENTILKMKLFQALPSSSSPGFHSLFLCLTRGNDAGSATVLGETIQQHSPCLSSNVILGQMRAETPQVWIWELQTWFSAGSSQTSEISRYHGNPEGLKMLSESKECFVAISTDAGIFQCRESLIIANLR